MSTVERTTSESIHSEAKKIGELLEEKRASGPCLRCKNDKFFAFELSESTYVIVCSYCGLKFEHVRSILIDPDTAYLPTESEDTE